MKTVLTVMATSFAMLSAAAPSAAAPTAQQMVAAADAVRNPGNAFRITNTLTEYVNGTPKNESTVIVYAKADAASRQYQNIVRYTAPANAAGKLLLLSGTTLWFYDSQSKTSVRIAPQQRLLGQASNGDVLTANLAVDYSATLKGEEVIESSEGQKIGCWILDLKASTRSAVYDHMIYWLAKDTYRPVKAKFFSSSGRVLKIAFFQKYVESLGAQRPAETIIIDGVDPHLVTTIRTSGAAFQAIPDFWFQRDFLPRIPFR